MMVLGGLVVIAIVLIVAVAIVRFLLDYVSRYGFALFAWWRIIVGSLGLAGLYAIG